MEERYTHEPVLLSEVLDLMVTDKGGVYLDATLGLGGHAEAVLEALAPSGRLIAVDTDPEALAHATRRLDAHGGRLRAVRANFRNLSSVLAAEPPASLSGALFDLGVSSLQLDKPSRGFAFRFEGPLDMRLDP
ncbi:MAG: 16S rRNA (cytosine(1402)-N(4))-methyltransferase, partial [Elusimicrobia bacterium]|nr:16S rRNA (cytosine(1402)-N(4))-methyltransferase [Elusimicrobiota bacterium]